MWTVFETYGSLIGSSRGKTTERLFFGSPEQLGCKKLGRQVYREPHNANQKKSKPKMSFVDACKKEGYMKKGTGFKPLPKRNSDAYNKIVRHMK
jgi:hypothetical protein